MFDVETIKEFWNRGFGWLTPEGALVVCDMYDHYKALGETYSSRYRALVEKHNQEMHDILDAEQANLKEDEYYHPEMHRFDAESDAANDLQKELSTAGYLRLGINKRKPAYIEAEGSEVAYQKHKATLHFLFDMLDVETLRLTQPSIYRYGKSTHTIKASKR